jgi:hypothetical protein
LLRFAEGGALHHDDSPREARFTMTRFLYVVWFQVPRLPPNDQGYEWPACFLIHGETPESAQEWGDHLANGYSKSAGEVFLRSSIEPSVPGEDPANDALPKIHEGQEASRDHIGW